MSDISSFVNLFRLCFTCCFTLAIAGQMQEIPKKDIWNIRVSSVLNRDVRSYGKQNLFDGCSDSCWNSDEGSPQWVVLEFSEPFKITGIEIEFQGGFVGQDCMVEMNSDGRMVNEPFYPEDANGIQKFSLSKPHHSQNLKLVFNRSTDFFGRIVIYSIHVYKEVT